MIISLAQLLSTIFVSLVGVNAYLWLARARVAFSWLGKRSTHVKINSSYKSCEHVNVWNGLVISQCSFATTKSFEHLCFHLHNGSWESRSPQSDVAGRGRVPGYLQTYIACKTMTLWLSLTQINKYRMLTRCTLVSLNGADKSNYRFLERKTRTTWTIFV